MKFNLTLIVMLLFSCSTNNLNYSKSKKTFKSTGFALIYDKHDYDNKYVNIKLKNDKPLASHAWLKAGTMLRITNPDNKKSLILENQRKSKYPSFYKILINEKAASKLEIEKLLPYVEIQEIKKNKSFVAKKAEMFSEEKKIDNKAPVTKVKIDNISKTQKTKIVKKTKKFDIIIVEFYSLNSANLLKEKLKSDLEIKDKKKIKVFMKKKNSYEVLSGPYSKLEELKKDFVKFSNYGFEELDIRFYD
tara:strand:+ start:211 stop:951 length:741 start_codon:yes stop_codon:yes gene_type:complete